MQGTVWVDFLAGALFNPHLQDVMAYGKFKHWIGTALAKL